MLRTLRYWPVLALSIVLAGLVLFFRSPVWELFSPTDPRPTYIMIVLDDFDWDLVAQDWSGETNVAPRFPVLHELAANGMVFSNFHATTPVCGPARASILSGQYAHRHQARVNRPDHPTAHGFGGGFAEYGRNRDFARFFQAKGYQTCFVGKYVHDGFQPNADIGTTWRDVMPHGWDRFHACLGANYMNFFVVDSATMETKTVAERYRIDYEADRVIELLAEQDAVKQAQMLCWLALAPHDTDGTGKSNPPRFEDWFQDETPPSFARQTGAYGLKLPSTLHGLPEELSAGQRSMVVEKWRERLRTIKAFDENLGRVRDYLAKAGRLENTVFVITSDHGYRLGDHGHVGKRLPYDRITCVPLLVSGKSIPVGRSDFLLANIDLAPTLIDLALGPEAVSNTDFDGKSFAPLLMQPHIEPFQREEILIECWEAEVVWGHRVPGVWSVLRGKNYSYTEWATGDREYYQMDVDPNQLDNRYGSLAPEQIDDLHLRLSQLRNSTDRLPIVSVPLDSWERLKGLPQNPTYVPMSLTGFVDADLGVKSVGLEVYDEEQNQYWNGIRWQDSVAQLPAELKNPGGLMSLWSFQVRMQPSVRVGVDSTSRLPVSEQREQRVQLTVRATSNNGQVFTKTLDQDLQLRLMDPETWIVLSEKSRGSGGGFTLNGCALGEFPIQKVRIVVQDTQKNQYWNGQDWVPDFAQCEAQVQPLENGGARWNFAFLGEHEGSLFVGARALDAKFNYDRTPAFFRLDSHLRDWEPILNNALKPEQLTILSELGFPTAVEN
jgi:arylsulfatase A-like enzyme